jgi:hypothetical protein
MEIVSSQLGAQPRSYISDEVLFVPLFLKYTALTLSLCFVASLYSFYGGKYSHLYRTEYLRYFIVFSEYQFCVIYFMKQKRLAEYQQQ